MLPIHCICFVQMRVHTAIKKQMLPVDFLGQGMSIYFGYLVHKWLPTVMR